ncbi:MAG: MFS transporter [Chloroflexi bacterium]|nr:MFS transporter [Chloroflexota bacterium]MQC17296.1 MFS transporter [Chloroflexota bacterium]
MRRNLRLLPWWWVLRWAWLGEGIWVIYLTDTRGLTLGQALLFEAVFSAVVIATEVPTGMVADRFGRRLSLLIGSAFVVLAFLAFGTGSSLVVLLLTYAFVGLGETSFSGADTAMLYDSLKAEGRESAFTLWHGRLNALVAAGIGAFTVAGSLMVRWLPMWTPFIASAALSAPAIVLAWLMREPPRSDQRRGYIQTGREGVSVVLRSPPILTVMLLMAVTTVAISAMAVLQQPFLRGGGIPIWGVGMFVAVQMGAAAVGSWLATPLGRWLGIHRIFWFMPLGSALALFAGASGSVYLYPLFIFPALGWKVMFPHFTDYVATRVTDSLRATALSVANVVGSMASISLIPLLGLGVDRLGYNAALAILGLILTVAVVATYRIWARVDASTGPVVP